MHLVGAGAPGREEDGRRATLDHRPRLLRCDGAHRVHHRYDVDGELLWDELWDEERNAGFQLEGQGDDHARLGEGQGGSWESDEESEPLGQRAKRLREWGGERS